MRVLHITPAMTPEYGGPFESIRNLTAALDQLGLDVSVRMPHCDRAIGYQDYWRAPMRSEGKVRLSALGYSPEFRRLILSEDVDVIHTHGLWQHASWVGIAWKRRYARPHVASIRGMLQPWAWQHHAWKKRPAWAMWERRNLRTASLLHAASALEAEAIRHRGLKSPIALIPNGVHVPAFDARSGKSAETYGQRTALFLSRLHPSKGIALLLEAWARVRPVDWRLRIVGPDEVGHRSELERQAAMLHLGEQVEFQGPLSGQDKEHAFQTSDLFILPTYSENFGISVAEALAHGLPVITTHGAPWQGLETHEAGWWVPVSIAAIAEALEDACQATPERLERMGAAGRSWMLKEFSWEASAREFSNCYQWICGRGPRPSCVDVGI